MFLVCCTVLGSGGCKVRRSTSLLPKQIRLLVARIQESHRIFQLGFQKLSGFLMVEMEAKSMSGHRIVYAETQRQKNACHVQELERHPQMEPRMKRLTGPRLQRARNTMFPKEFYPVIISNYEKYWYVQSLIGGLTSSDKIVKETRIQESSPRKEERGFASTTSLYDHMGAVSTHHIRGAAQNFRFHLSFPDKHSLCCLWENALIGNKCFQVASKQSLEFPRSNSNLFLLIFKLLGWRSWQGGP